jgi:hypothetical protein
MSSKTVTIVTAIVGILAVVARDIRQVQGLPPAVYTVAAVLALVLGTVTTSLLPTKGTP